MVKLRDVLPRYLTITIFHEIVKQSNTQGFSVNAGDSAYNTFMGILTSLKVDTLVFQHANDFDFFVNAMEMASRHFCDRQAGELVNELLLTGDNYKFIGNNYKVSMSSYGRIDKHHDVIFHSS